MRPAISQYTILDVFEKNSTQTLSLAAHKDNLNELVIINEIKWSPNFTPETARLLKLTLSSLNELYEDFESCILITSFSDGIDLNKYLKQNTPSATGRLNLLYKVFKAITVYQPLPEWLQDLLIDLDQMIVEDDDIKLNELIVIPTDLDTHLITFKKIRSKIQRITSIVIEKSSVPKELDAFIKDLKSPAETGGSLYSICESYQKLYLSGFRPHQPWLDSFVKITPPAPILGESSTEEIASQSRESALEETVPKHSLEESIQELISTPLIEEDALTPPDLEIEALDITESPPLTVEAPKDSEDWRPISEMTEPLDIPERSSVASEDGDFRPQSLKDLMTLLDKAAEEHTHKEDEENSDFPAVEDYDKPMSVVITEAEQEIPSETEHNDHLAESPLVTVPSEDPIMEDSSLTHAEEPNPTESNIVTSSEDEERKRRLKELFGWTDNSEEETEMVSGEEPPSESHDSSADIPERIAYEEQFDYSSWITDSSIQETTPESTMPTLGIEENSDAADRKRRLKELLGWEKPEEELNQNPEMVSEEENSPFEPLEETIETPVKEDTFISEDSVSDIKTVEPVQEESELPSETTAFTDKEPAAVISNPEDEERKKKLRALLGLDRLSEEVEETEAPSSNEEEPSEPGASLLKMLNEEDEHILEPYTEEDLSEIELTPSAEIAISRLMKMSDSEVYGEDPEDEGTESNTSTEDAPSEERPNTITMPLLDLSKKPAWEPTEPAMNTLDDEDRKKQLRKLLGLSIEDSTEDSEPEIENIDHKDFTEFEAPIEETLEDHLETEAPVEENLEDHSEAPAFEEETVKDHSETAASTEEAVEDHSETVASTEEAVEDHSETAASTEEAVEDHSETVASTEEITANTPVEKPAVSKTQEPMAAYVVSNEDEERKRKLREMLGMKAEKLAEVPDTTEEDHVIEKDQRNPLLDTSDDEKQRKDRLRHLLGFHEEDMLAQAPEGGEEKQEEAPAPIDSESEKNNRLLLNRLGIEPSEETSEPSTDTETSTEAEETVKKAKKEKSRKKKEKNADAEPKEKTNKVGMVLLIILVSLILALALGFAYLSINGIPFSLSKVDSVMPWKPLEAKFIKEEKDGVWQFKNATTVPVGHNIASYEWKVTKNGQELQSFDTENIALDSKESGTFTISLRVQDNKGQWSNTFEDTITKESDTVVEEDKLSIYTPVYDNHIIIQDNTERYTEPYSLKFQPAEVPGVLELKNVTVKEMATVSFFLKSTVKGSAIAAIKTFSGETMTYEVGKGINLEDGGQWKLYEFPINAEGSSDKLSITITSKNPVWIDDIAISNH